MRTVVFLLLLANLTMFAYTRLDNVGGGEAVRLKEQVQPDKIKILTSQQVAALGPAKVAALSDVCAEWGPFAATDVTRAIADLEPLQLGRLLTQRRIDVDTSWVVIGPFANRAAAERRVAELKAQGVGEATVADRGGGQFVISFGVFRAADAAAARVDQLAKLGVQNAKAEPRPQALTQTALVVRDPQQSAMTRIKDLLAQYPGSDLKVGGCPTT
jgi:hypothetical protein